MGDIVRQRQRTGGGGNRIGSLDIVLDQDRNAMQRPARTLGLAFGVQRLRPRQRIGIERDDAVELRAGLSMAAMRA